MLRLINHMQADPRAVLQGVRKATLQRVAQEMGSRYSQYQRYLHRVVSVMASQVCVNCRLRVLCMPWRVEARALPCSAANGGFHLCCAGRQGGSADAASYAAELQPSLWRSVMLSVGYRNLCAQTRRLQPELSTYGL